VPVKGLTVVTALAAAGALLYFSPAGELFDTDLLVSEVRNYSDTWWAPILFMLLYLVLNIFFIPPQALSIAAVVAWGWIVGGAVELVVATFTALFPYWIARSAARTWVEARLRRHERIMEMLQREGFSLLLAMRLIPLIPYTALNYAAGFSAIRTIPYLVATFIGMIPPVFIFAYFVDALLAGLMQPTDIMVRMVAAGILLAILVLITRLGTRMLRRRLHVEDDVTVLEEDRGASPRAAADRD
jgi:uncharacterized membrane protein YdjX (TVP38/TMEM64 family)